MAEVVKTGLLAGRPYWELEEEQMVRATRGVQGGGSSCRIRTSTAGARS